jgi:hypothetical protein
MCPSFDASVMPASPDTEADGERAFVQVLNVRGNSCSRSRLCKRMVGEIMALKLQCTVGYKKIAANILFRAWA